MQFIKVNRKQYIEDESGVVYILLIFVVLGVFIFSALAIDIANIFKYSITLKQSLNSSTIAAGKILSLTEQNLKTSKIPLLQQVVKDTINLSFKGVNSNIQCGVTSPGGEHLDCSNTTIDPINDTVTTTATLTIPLLLINRFIGIQTFNITQSAKSEVQPAIVSLLLDTSGSMACPADGSSCNPCGQNNTCVNSKFSYLIQATNQFVTAFNPNKDFLGITYFALGTYPVLDMNANGSFDLAQVNAALTNNVNVSASNQADALFSSRLYLLNTGAANTPLKNLVNAESPVAYILVTDGGPTASRFFFANTKPALDSNNELGGSFTEFDYYSYKVTFPNPLGPTLPGIYGTSELGKNIALNNHTTNPAYQYLYTTYGWPYYWKYGSVPQTLVQKYPEQQFEVGPPITFPNDITIDLLPSSTCSKSIINDPNKAFDECLIDFSFYTFDNIKKWGASVPFTDFKKQYYNTAIAMSDSIRNTHGVVFTIGLGPSASLGIDPYQLTNPADEDKRKDVFFARLANDPIYKSYAQFPNEFSDFSTNATLTGNYNIYQTEGSYLPVDNAASLATTFNEMFNRIVRKIKVIQLTPP